MSAPGPPPREAAIGSLRSLLREYGLTDAAEVLDVVDAADEGVLVRFRWRADPRRYAIRIAVDADSLATDLRCDLPLDEPERWPVQARGYLVDELDTGAVARQPRRRLADGTWEIDLAAPPLYDDRWQLEPVRTEERRVRPTTELAAHALQEWRRTGRDEFVVIGGGPPADTTVVPLPHPGEELAVAGLDVTLPRRWVAEGRLLAWFSVAVRPHEHPMAYAAAGRDPSDARAAELTAALGGDVDDAGVRMLLRATIFHAAAEGTERLWSRLEHPALDAFAFGPPDHDSIRHAAVVDG